jgi:pimeloyl-ACP methyl ester carboxylesterase
MHQQLPGSKLVILENSGHMMQVEEPAAVSSAIEAFMADLA